MFAAGRGSPLGARRTSSKENFDLAAYFAATVKEYESSPPRTVGRNPEDETTASPSKTSKSASTIGDKGSLPPFASTVTVKRRYSPFFSSLSRSALIVKERDWSFTVAGVNCV